MNAMDNILQRIAATKRREVEAAKRVIAPDEMARMARLTTRLTASLRQSIKTTPGGIIAEFKRRSPSRGEIAPMADVTEVIEGYTQAEAAGCSVLTDTAYFGGSLADLNVARSVTTLPLLRKEFIVDSYQIGQARVNGADAILLIAALLSPGEIAGFTAAAHDLGLEVLLELHNPSELASIDPSIDLIGINNRDLTTFSTDLSASMAMIDSLPANAVKIAESGIKTPADMKRLRDAGFDGFLIGEALISTPDPAMTLKKFTDGND